MRRFLERVHAKSTEIDKAWAIIDHLEGDARNYIIKKSAPERNDPEKVFTLLTSRFGTGGNNMHIRQTFIIRVRLGKIRCNTWMLGVRYPILRQELAVVYASLRCT